MPAPFLFPIRNPCPPGACICDHEGMLEDKQADLRILQLTQKEEKILLSRLENIESYAELRRMQQRMQEQLGIVLTITPSSRGVRTIRGLSIKLADQRGLCRKTRQNIPAAIRRCLEKNTALAFAIVDAHGLLASTHEEPGT